MIYNLFNIYSIKCTKHRPNQFIAFSIFVFNISIIIIELKGNLKITVCYFGTFVENTSKV